MMLVAEFVVTVTSCVPVPLGEVAVSKPEEITLTSVAGVDPKSTVVEDVKPEPLMTTSVPPAGGPAGGEIRRCQLDTGTTGAGCSVCSVRPVGERTQADQNGDDNAGESVLPHLVPSLESRDPRRAPGGLWNAGARRLSIRLAEPAPGRAGGPGHMRSERGADGATLG